MQHIHHHVHALYTDAHMGERSGAEETEGERGKQRERNAISAAGWLCVLELRQKCTSAMAGGYEHNGGSVRAQWQKCARTMAEV